MNDDALSIAREISDRSRTRELLASQTIANDPDAWEAFLAFVEVNLPVFGVGFYAGAMFTAGAAYVWSFFL